MSVERIHRAFQQRTGPARRQSYAELETLLINNRDDRQVASFFQGYEQRYGRGSFQRDLQAYVDAMQDAPAMRQFYRQRFIDRLGQAGISLFGRPLPPPPAVGYAGTPEQTQRWLREFLTYFETDPRARQLDAAVRRTALWVLRHWADLQPGGSLHDVVNTCGWLPSTATQQFRASFNILSPRADGRNIGIQEGVGYFRAIAGQIRQRFNTVMGDAQRYNEVYGARCHPLTPPGSRTTPADTGRVWPRLSAWNDVVNRGGPLPVLTQREQQFASNFGALTDCWAVSPSPAHTCGQAAQNAGIGAVGVL